MNIKNPYTNKFYTYDEAAARFETSIFSGHSYHLVNGTWVLESNDSVAYSNFGQPGWIFGPPNARFGQLAMQTGGRMCPLMDICTPSTVNDATGCQSAADPTPAGCPACSNGCYQRDPNNTCGPCILREETRVENSPQTCSLTDQSIALQAAECASKTIGDDPFVFIK
ncbi:MAG: hypothetical protein DCC75_00140 [Proteobacteria bacterium]|nr:MAG: hypothetical protein DCC75_00140 [Pseudomonadota bacterium]